MLCAVLDLADALHQIVTHLTTADCQRLRQTCRLLRQHPAVVEGVTEVWDDSLYHQGLLKLHDLRRLHLLKPSSVFDAQHLSRLSGLCFIAIYETSILDLKPLSCIASLRHLVMHSVQSYASLDSVTQLKSLQFTRTAATPALAQLSALTWLSLNEGSQAAKLGELSQLRHLQICASRDSWTADADAALAAAVQAGLPTLRSLTCGHKRLQALHVHSLAQLTSLRIMCGNSPLPEALHDLRQLTSLEKLGLDRHRGPANLLSDTVAVLYLVASSSPDVSFPGLVGCGRLENIMLNLSPLCVDAEYDIYAEQLPANVKTLWLDEHAGMSQLFLNMQAIRTLRMRFVSGLSWNSDPAKLDG